MRRAVSSIGIGIAIIVASWAFFLDVAILYEAHGLWISLLGLLLAPITYFAVPLYAGVALDNWLPFAVGYGSAVAGIALARWVRRL